MGKASRWFRAILGLKKSSDQQPRPSTTTTATATQCDSKPSKERRKWSFGKSFREKEDRHSTRGRSSGEASMPHSSSLEYRNGVDQNKHAIAVAAATSAVAEAAVAAAQAAAAVVRLTSSSGRCNCSSSSYNRNAVFARENFAAVKIQSTFRGYLAKRALRALKGLVKLQALVRGHNVRKQTEETWRRIQFLLRAQERAFAGRALVSDSPLSSSKSSHHLYTGPATPEKFEQNVRVKPTRHNQPTKLKRNGSASKSSRVMNGQFEIDDEEKILKIDPGEAHSITTSKDSTTRQTGQTYSSSGEVQSLSHSNCTNGNEEESFCTAYAENSPQLYYSASSSRGGSTSRRSSGPFTPSKSYLSGYSDHPNYMACTQSSKAKLRSLSAPKQRPHFERSISAKRYSAHGYSHSRSNSQKISETFYGKAYDGSGQLDRLLGVPY